SSRRSPSRWSSSACRWHTCTPRSTRSKGWRACAGCRMTLSTDERPADVGPGIPEAGTVLAIRGEADLLRVRSALRTEAGTAGLGLTAATKLVTAGSELARNIVRYATGARGTVTIEPL